MSTGLREKLSARTKGEARLLVQGHLSEYGIGFTDQKNFIDGRSKWTFIYERDDMNLCSLANDLAARGISVEVVGNSLICAILKATEN